MSKQVGNGSLCFSKAPFIISTASVVGAKEGEGPLKGRLLHHPLEYANQRPKSSTWTVTGNRAFLVATEEKAKGFKAQPIAKITGVTTGKIVDFGIKDFMNMGAAMAPAVVKLTPYPIVKKRKTRR